MKTRIALIVTSAIGVLIVFWIIRNFFSPQSYLAVQAACAKDGGLRIDRFVHVESYWHAPYNRDALYEGDKGCDGCKEAVAMQKFSFIEFGPTSDSTDNGMHYRRFELAPIGSESCLSDYRWEKPPNDMCVAQTPIEKPISRYYVKANVSESDKGFDILIRSYRYSVYDREEKKVLATFNHYEAGTPLERQGAFAWGYKCTPANVKFEDQFVDRVLRSPEPQGRTSSAE